MRKQTANSGRRAASLTWMIAPLLVCAIGCASTSPDRQVIRDDTTMERVNRPVFTVNRVLDDHAFGPLARGYKKVTPGVVRQSISNVQRNLTFPQRFVSSLGQGELEKAGTELGRFLLNSTVGIGGLFDPASRVGLAKYDEDLGMMFASWHVPPGPFIVIPILGPSTPRDAIGDLLSIGLNPLVWTGVSIPPIGVLFAINRRAQADDQIRAGREAALDYYVFVRDAFIQRRTRQIRNEYVTRLEDGELTDAGYFPPDDLYDLPEQGASADAAPGGCAPPADGVSEPAVLAAGPCE